MRIAGIGSTTLYYKCIKDLHAWEYISYEPSNSIYTGSKISMRRFDVVDQPDTQLDSQLNTQLDDQVQVQSINSSNYTIFPLPLPGTDADDIDTPDLADDLPGNYVDDELHVQLDTQLNDQLQVQSINNSNLPAPVPGGNTESAVPVPDKTLDWLTQDDAEPPEREPEPLWEKTYIPDREVQPPSLGEVVKYFEERHFDMRDARTFYKYHEALGWVGKRKVPIEDWQMYALCWMGRIARSLLWENRLGRPRWQYRGVG